MKCPNCNKKIPDGAIFCNHCGVKIESHLQNCSNSRCGRSNLPSEAMFCPDCGTKLVADFASFTETVNGVSFDMVAVEGGTFIMRDGSEVFSAYGVTLENFYIARIPVTQYLWESVMGNINPSEFKNDTFPVEHVSWYDCQIFIEKLNKATGKLYQLPTEAQWEFAARGGNLSLGYKYSGNNNPNEVAWFDDYEGHSVGRKKPNELGLFDMSGNVWEWCNDWFDLNDDHKSLIHKINPKGDKKGTVKIIRGGDLLDTLSLHSHEVSYFYWCEPNTSDYGFIGFRLALSL